MFYFLKFSINVMSKVRTEINFNIANDGKDVVELYKLTTTNNSSLSSNVVFHREILKVLTSFPYKK